MYCSDTDEWDQHHEGAYFQTIIEPLMNKYKVDLYMCGHMHMYERVWPVLNGTVYGYPSSKTVVCIINICKRFS